ncbi:MAG: methyltransferase domain-containing protein [Isosphaeraceae bacterium]
MQRRRRPEIMDQPNLDRDEHVRALVGLHRINVLSRTASILWPEIARLAGARTRTGKPLRILDVATGGGDTPLALARRAQRVGLPVEIDGCDISAQAIDYARSKAETTGTPVRFFQHNALDERLPAGYDVICCSLFLHHLAEDEAIGLLKQMASAAGSLVLVDDLIRSRQGYLLAVIACHVLSRSRIVRNDGPVSVAAAYTPDEALALAERAGLSGAVLKRHWPRRFLVSWSAQ